MDRFLDQVAQSIRSRRLFRRGQPILVAVSGGLDSMVLLHALHALAAPAGWRLTVAHLNHQLRGRSSQADERLVRRTAQTLRLPLVAERADVRRFGRTRKLSLEMAARKVRHDFLARSAARLQIPTVALAHHADDQLELFFLRLLRGSGPEGLAGMKWRNPSPSDPNIELTRPLLGQPKTALRQFADQNHIPFREDATNACLQIQRNRLRHHLLPLLRRDYQPALDKTLLRVMDILGEEADFVTRAARIWLGSEWQGPGPRCRKADSSSSKTGESKSITRTKKPSSVQSSTFNLQPSTPFATLPVAVQRRALQLQLLGLAIPPDYDLVEQLRQKAGRAISVGAQNSAGGTPLLRRVTRDASGKVLLHLGRAPEFQPGSLQVDLQDRAGEVLFDGVRIRWRIAPTAPGRPHRARPGWECFDAAKIGSSIVLRHWRPGDRFQPIGLDFPVKLQDFFTNQKVPRRQRHALIVAETRQGEVFWVEGMRIAQPFKLTKKTTRRLQWTWIRP